jgi:hypothetical protein
MNIYVTLIDISSKVFTQSKKTAGAILQSFETTKLYFLNDSIIPLTSHELFQFDEVAYWYFDTATTTFVYSNATPVESKHLPYISATLNDSGIAVGNLSEWIETVHCKSPPDIVLPLKVLVVTWAYCNLQTLNYSLEKYTLAVFTDQGEEKTFKVLTGEEVA